jgi:hypothetical protein
MTTTTTTNPARWNTNADGSLVCPHRDLSVCPSCLAAHDTVIDVFGAAYYTPDPVDRARFAIMAMSDADLRALCDGRTRLGDDRSLDLAIWNLAVTEENDRA